MRPDVPKTVLIVELQTCNYCMVNTRLNFILLPSQTWRCMAKRITSCNRATLLSPMPNREKNTCKYILTACDTLPSTWTQLAELGDLGKNISVWSTEVSPGTSRYATEDDNVLLSRIYVSFQRHSIFSSLSWIHQGGGYIRASLPPKVQSVKNVSARSVCRAHTRSDHEPAADRGDNNNFLRQTFCRLRLSLIFNLFPHSHAPLMFSIIICIHN